MRDLNKEESDKYLELVRNGNKDDMFDYGYQLGLADGEKYEKTSASIRENKVQ